MKKFLLIFFLLFTVGLLNVSAQNRTLRGKVINGEDKKPIAGATVIVAGTSNGGITDNDGMFEIPNIKGEIKLDVSFIGFETKIVPVAPTVTNITIDLKSSSLAMDDVVVTGYGNYTKKSFTGAATNVNMGAVADMPAVSVENKLAGSVAGVTVTTNQGGPGSTASIRIRGRGSMNAGTQPLYVIDGVPMASGTLGGLTANGGGNSILASINPSDIASMTVIKDAAAASLYGSRAANGVVVITTKQGQVGKSQVNVKLNWGFADRAVNFRPTLGGDARRSLLETGYTNEADRKGLTGEKREDYIYKNGIDTYAAKPWSGWSDWNDILYRKGFYQNYEASISGGNETARYFASISYTDQEGIMEPQELDRITGRVNVTAKKGRFTFTGGTIFSVVKQTAMWATTATYAYSSPIVHAAWYSSPSQYPYINEDKAMNHKDDPAKWEKGGKNYSLWFPSSKGQSPLVERGLNEFENAYNRTMANASASFNIIKGLDIKETFSYDVMNERSYEFYNPESESGKATGGWLTRRADRLVKMVSQTHLTYKTIIADKHSIDAIAGYEVEKNPFNWQESYGENYTSAKLPEILNAGVNKGNSGFSDSRLVSWVASADYNYDSRYYIKGSYRRDGSSRLAPAARWGNFWSVSGSWVISNEKFAQSDVVTLAKLRASYGVNGTQPWDYYGYMGLYSYGYKYADKQGLAQSQVMNDQLSWEKNYSTNIGIDLSFWDRMNITLDIYNRDTRDLLMSKDVSQTTGFKTILKNVGSLNNKGIEFAINGDVITTADLNWNIGLNFAHNKNTVKDLGGQNEILDYWRIYRVGENYNSFYLKQFAGIDPATGDPLYYSNKPSKWDEDGNPTEYRKDLVSYDKANQAFVEGKSADVKLGGAITSDFTWKGLDFSFMLTYTLGGWIYDGINYQFATDDNLFKGAVPIYYDESKMWKNPGDVAELPLFRYGRLSDGDSDVHLMSSNHLRLKNITLGYSLPKAWMNKIGVERIRIYGSASNLLTWKSKDCYVDPEAYYISSFESPNNKTVTFGIDLTF